jgi:hypothetical protein
MKRESIGFAVILALAGTAAALAQPADAPPTAPVKSVLEITVIAKQIEEGRLTIQPSLGASTYQFTPDVI